MSPSQLPAVVGSGDMFLAVKGARTGVIKGESQDRQHKGEIDVLSWSWGMQASTDAVTGATIGGVRRSELTVVKKADSASTALMTALRSNEPLKEVILTVRKSGSTKQLDYLKVTLEKGRVTSVTIDGGDSSGHADVVERVKFAFGKITIDYVPQGNDGQPLGSMSFSDEWTGVD